MKSAADPSDRIHLGSRIRGFTLIELLVVIGIIAILALIALPNMLEAQTRAKVSRVKSDMRTVVLGLETYHVDHNAYPTYHYTPNQKSTANQFSFHVGGVSTAVFVSPVFNGPNPITSPIAYLTSFPKDVFGDKDPAAPNEANEFYYTNWDYALTFAGGFTAAFESLRSYQGNYRIFSPGPDRGGPDFIDGTNIPYDPTNGTVSMGDVARFQRF